MISAPPRLVVFSGAGLSAESGLSTFRGPSGLWEGVSIRTVCDISTWEDNFDAVHEFYDSRRAACADAKPNLAHRTIAAWQKKWPERVVVLTQNIDRLLEQAGCTEVIKLHGDIRILRCFDCGQQWEIERLPYDRQGCRVCGSARIKPGVVFFGEPAPRYRALHAIVSTLREIDTAVVVGTSGAVISADRLFGQSAAYSVLVNLEPGIQMDESAFTEQRYGPATDHLPALSQLISRRMSCLKSVKAPCAEASPD